MGVKKILIIILSIVASVTSFANDYFIATASVNVRTGAGKGYAVTFKLQEGDEVEVLSKNGNWYQVRYLGKTGFVHSKYLKYSRTTTDTYVQPFEQSASYLLPALCIGFAVLIVFFFYKSAQDKKLIETVTDLQRGVQSERDLVLKFLKAGVPADVIFHDLYVEKRSGEFSQIDLVVVTQVGIIVVEVKDYSGWIFGSGNQSQWTQVLAYGKQKYRFYNPIMQNNKHVSELRKQLIVLGDIPYYSVIVFYGNCVLKEINFVPDGTLLVKSERILEALKTILHENTHIRYDNEEEVFRILKRGVANGGIIENQIRHRENIRDMLGRHRIFD